MTELLKEEPAEKTEKHPVLWCALSLVTLAGLIASLIITYQSLMAAFRVERGQDGGYLATPLSLRGPKSAGSAAALMADGVYITTPGDPPLEAGATITIELLKNRAELHPAQ